MPLMSEPFDFISEADISPCSAQGWQCIVLSLVMHVVMACIVVFCAPAIATHRETAPPNDIIMVSMDNLPTLPGQAGGAGAQAAGGSSAPPKPAPEKTESPKPSKPAPIHVKSKPKPLASVHTKPKATVSITKAKSRENVETPPESAPISENMHYAEAAKESPPAETTPPPSGTGSASQGGNAISGSGISGKGNAPGGSGGNGHGQGTGSGTGTGSAAGSGTGTVEGKFGTSSGPSFIHRVKPSYPRRAQVLGKEGTVVLRLTVDRTGKLSHVEVVTCAGFGLDEEAVRAVRSSTFSPAVRNGHPVTCVAELSVRFKLESNG